MCIKPHGKPQFEEFILCPSACLIIQGVKITLSQQVATTATAIVTANMENVEHMCTDWEGKLCV